MVILSFAALAVACGGGALNEPKAPPLVDPETRAQPRQKDDPRLIAPPPAYGNKVVMAGVGQAGAVN
jgi:hypothetical protein